MTLLIAALVFTACMFGLGYLAAMWRYRRRAQLAEERADAAVEDADGLAEDLRGLQAAIADGFRFDTVQLDPPRMRRTEALFFDAAERQLRRSWRRARSRRRESTDLPQT